MPPPSRGSFLPLLTACLFGSGTVLADDGKAIYGQDGRAEVVDAKDPALKTVSRSVAALFETARLLGTGEERPVLPARADSPEGEWCPDEKFTEQPNGALCTAFLIAPNRLATSAHCIKPEDDDDALGIDCDDVTFVFDYRLDESGRVDTKPDESAVYRCDRVVDGESFRTGPDWRVVQLDRVVADRDVLEVYRGELLPTDTPLDTIGHPNGLPAKVSSGGKLVEHRDEDGYFITDLDTYRGNSGSPVLARLGGTPVVVGVLSRGAEDFEPSPDGNCVRSRLCDVETCGGEHATRSDQLKDWPSIGVMR